MEKGYMHANRSVRWFPAFFLIGLAAALIVLAVSVWIQARMLTAPPPVEQVIATGRSAQSVVPADIASRPDDAPIRVDVVATRPRNAQHASLRDCARAQLC